MRRDALNAVAVRAAASDALSATNIFQRDHELRTRKRATYRAAFRISSRVILASSIRVNHASKARRDVFLCIL